MSGCETLWVGSICLCVFVCEGMAMVMVKCERYEGMQSGLEDLRVCVTGMSYEACNGMRGLLARTREKVFG